MSTRAALRRSRRAPKKSSDYNVGDIVQITRGNAILEARLAQLLTEGSSPNPRWLIKFDGQPHKDEEVYEHTFGKVLVPADDVTDNTSNPDTPVAPAQRRSKPTATTSNGGKKGSSSGSGSGSNKGSGSSEGEVEAEAVPAAAEPVNGAKIAKKSNSGNGNNNKKSVSFSNESSPIGSDASETGGESGGNGKISAREQRSRRRQAMIDEHGGILAAVQPGNSSNGKRRLPQNTNKSKAKRPRSDADEECVKIKLLTGTLYLYRGRHRRAEFVRRL